MLKKILELCGLVRISDIRDLEKNPYTEDELDSMYIPIAYTRASGWSKDKYQVMLDLLKKNREFVQFLDWTIVEDVKRSFNATDIERPIIRGAVSRTRYLRSLCTGPEEVKAVMEKKMTRYAR